MRKSHVAGKSQIMRISQVMTFAKALILSGVLILVFSWQPALEASTGAEIPILTVADALDLTAFQNPEIVAAEQALELSGSRLRESRGSLKPKIVLQGSGHGTLTASPTGVSTSGSGSSVKVTISQSLPGILPEPFSVGLSPIDLAAINLHEAELDLAKTKQKALLDTIAAYLNVLKLEQLKALSDSAHEKAARLLDEVESKLALGVATQLDLLKARNQLDQATFSRQKTGDDLQSAMRSLALVLGLPPETPFQLSDALDVPGLLQMEEDEYSLEEFISIALGNRVEIKQADLSYLRAKASLETTKRSLKPSVNIFTNYSRQDPTSVSASASLDLASGDAGWKVSLDSGQSTESAPDKGLGPKSASTVGIDVSFVLWDGGTAEEKLKQAEISLKTQEASRERQKQAIAEDIYAASTALKQARIRLQLAEKAVLEAEESFRITEARFQAGAGVATEIIDATQSLAASRSGVVEGLFDYYLAQARLAKAIGLLDVRGWER
jgi:outer membrane protein